MHWSVLRAVQVEQAVEHLVCIPIDSTIVCLSKAYRQNFSYQKTLVHLSTVGQKVFCFP